GPGDIGRQHERTASPFLDFLAGSLETVPSSGEQADAGAALREFPDGCPPHTRRGSRDHDDIGFLHDAFSAFERLPIVGGTSRSFSEGAALGERVSRSISCYRCLVRLSAGATSVPRSWREPPLSKDQYPSVREC